MLTSDDRVSLQFRATLQTQNHGLLKDESVREVFDYVDQDNNGAVTIDEFDVALRRLQATTGIM